jgi:diguanylate cyclase (GGDEF)-like protein/PAS domain S-box-containing protein
MLAPARFVQARSGAGHGRRTVGDRPERPRIRFTLRLVGNLVDHGHGLETNSCLPCAQSLGAIPVEEILTNSHCPVLTETRFDATDPGDVVFELGRTERVDADTLETVLKSLLARYPDAPVAASGADGVARPMPESIPLQRNPVLQSPSSLHLVVPDDRVRLLATWDRVLAGGAARCLAHLSDNPDVTVAYSGLDLRERHGVLLAVFIPADAAEEPAAEVRESPKTLPRFSTMGKDERSFIVKSDEAITQILGWTAEELQGHRSIEFIHPDDHALALDNWMEMLASPGPGRRVRLRHRHRDQSWVWFEVTNHNLLDDPDHQCVVSELVDISAEMAAQDEIRAREQLLDTLAETIPLGLFQVDASREIVYTNDRLHEILGVGRTTTVHPQLASMVEDDRATLESALDEALDSGAAADIEVELQLPVNRETRYCTVNLRGVTRDDGTVSGAIVSVADVTDSAHMRNELARRATFDELTGCYNRASIMLALETNIAAGDRAAERAVLFVDLDRFKQVNDRYGHAAGDELLRIVAERLQGVVRPGDLVGRIGGDEFLAVCPDIGGLQQAVRLAERLTSVLSGDVRLSTSSITHHVSIGVAWSDSDDIDADSLVALADSAMYESKRRPSGETKLAKLNPEMAS